MRTTLIVLSVIAVILGIITYFVIFKGSGNYVVSGGTTSSIPAVTTVAPLATSTATGTVASSQASGTPSAFVNLSTNFPFPPVTWKEGNDTISITGASVAGNVLTLKLGVQMGMQSDCVPLNLRLVSSESGAMTPPQEPGFAFSGSGNCNGAAGAIYRDQAVTFTADPSQYPLLMTTGGNADIYFTVAVAPSGGIDIELPERSG